MAMPPSICTSKCRMPDLAPARLAHQGKRLGQQPIERFLALGPIAHAQAAFQQLLIAQLPSAPARRRQSSAAAFANGTACAGPRPATRLAAGLANVRKWSTRRPTSWQFDRVIPLARRPEASPAGRQASPSSRHSASTVHYSTFARKRASGKACAAAGSRLGQNEPIARRLDKPRGSPAAGQSRRAAGDLVGRRRCRISWPAVGSIDATS